MGNPEKNKIVRSLFIIILSNLLTIGCGCYGSLVLTGWPVDYDVSDDIPLDEIPVDEIEIEFDRIPQDEIPIEDLDVDDIPVEDFPPEDNGDFICDEPMPPDCLDFQTRLWPVSTDGGSTCRDSRGAEWPSTGENSAEWFDYIDCGYIKEFRTNACSRVDIKTRGDSCTGCTLWHINYSVEEWTGSSWIVTENHNPEPDYPGMTYSLCYLTTSGRFRIHAHDGFYVSVYGR